MLSKIVLIALSAAVAVTAVPASIPNCASGCIATVAKAATPCSATDYACICKPDIRNTIVTGATACIYTQCGSNGTAAVNSIGTFCSSFSNFSPVFVTVTNTLGVFANKDVTGGSVPSATELNPGVSVGTASNPHPHITMTGITATQVASGGAFVTPSDIPVAAGHSINGQDLGYTVSADPNNTHKITKTIDSNSVIVGVPISTGSVVGLIPTILPPSPHTGAPSSFLPTTTNAAAAGPAWMGAMGMVALALAAV